MNTPDELQTRANALRLYGLVTHWSDVAAQPWVAPLVQWEEDERSRRSLERRIRDAHLGSFKPLCDFNWTWPKMQEQRREFRSSVRGAGIALLLTLVPFALVHWGGLPRLPMLIVVGVFGLAQILVHFRCFLHISFAHKREDLQLILFSALLLTIMVGGPIWIMASLALRMAMPSS